MGQARTSGEFHPSPTPFSPPPPPSFWLQAGQCLMKVRLVHFPQNPRMLQEVVGFWDVLGGWMWKSVREASRVLALPVTDSALPASVCVRMCVYICVMWCVCVCVCAGS